MYRSIRFAFFLFIPILFCLLYIGGCNTLRNSGKVNLDVNAKPFEKLSDYQFFTGITKDLKPNQRIVPYDLNTPLFSDYAYKARFVYVPEGVKAVYDSTAVLNLPVGCCLIKNFYYPNDFRDESKGRRIMETRLLVHRKEGWDAIDYVWNEEQTEAMLDNTGDIKKVSWVHSDGSKREVDYVIPNKNQCKGCHWCNNSIQPIGPKVSNLNRDYGYAAGSENQLTHWSKLGILANLPALEACPKLANWRDSVHYSLEERAKAYLDVNCAHCHRSNGPAYTTGLYLNIENRNAGNSGGCKSVVAAGRATGGFLYDIAPGKPNESILIYRMTSEDPGVRMPEVGRQVEHVEGVALISQWIASLHGDCAMNK